MRIKPEIIWDVRKGDLVKIKVSDIYGKSQNLDGVVLEKIAADQQTLFPAAKVYIFKMSHITTILPSELVEIISSI
jgi:hypothetical protein